MGVCYICNNGEKNTALFPKEMFLGLRDVFPYVFCSSCRSLSIETIPTNLDEIYSKYPGLKHPQYKKSFIRNFVRRYMLTHTNFIAKTIAERLNGFNDLRLKALYNLNLTEKSKILDVGTGSGFFVYELHELGFKNTIGIEPALHADITFENGAQIFKKTLFDIDDKFDFITFHHTFEHLENPSQILQKVASLLKDDGICLISLPNIECWAFRFFKEHWSGIHPPYHLFLPSKKGMEILAKASGFKIVDMRFEQPVESLLRSFCYSLDFASHDEFGTRSLLKDQPLGRRKIPLFTEQELTFWKEKAKRLKKDKLTDHIVFYLQKSNHK